jgi:hypothetical protein
VPPDVRHFAPNRLRLAAVVAVAVATVVGVGLRLPQALWAVVPGLAIGLAVAAVGLPGLTLSPDGIAWYAVRPRWRFRTVPWGAVRDVHPRPFGLGAALHLIVAPGRYEPWVWGEPRRGGDVTLEIWLRGLERGDEVLDAIRGRLVRAAPAGGRAMP